jgi:hypothetical protein
VRPALTNLGKRKLRWLGAAYGERVIAVDCNGATGALLTPLRARIAIILRGIGNRYFIDCGGVAHLQLSFGTMGAGGLVQSTSGNQRSLY